MRRVAITPSTFLKAEQILTALSRVPPLHTVRCDDVDKARYIESVCNKGSRIMAEWLTKRMENVARSDQMRRRTNFSSGLNLRNESLSALYVDLRHKSLHETKSSFRSQQSLSCYGNQINSIANVETRGHNNNKHLNRSLLNYDVDIHQHFGGTCRVHVQGTKIPWRWKLNFLPKRRWQPIRLQVPGFRPLQKTLNVTSVIVIEG